MSEVISISNKSIRAVEGAEIPTFRVTGKVGEDFSGAMIAAIVESYDESRIVLDSVGGYASDAFHFYDYVRANGLKVYVDGYGNVASAATIMMAAAGRKRSRLAPNAEYLIHNATGGDAEQVARTNVKMAKIYAEISGRSERTILSIMKKDKPMSAEEAVNMGFVGSVIQLQRVAAKKVTDMEDTVKEVRTFAIDRDKALSAIVTGKVDIEVDVNAEMAERISAYADEVKELTAKLDELKAVEDAKAEAVKAKEDAEAALEAKTAEHMAEIEKIGKEAEALRAEVKAMKENPIAKKIAPAGDEVAEPTEAPKAEDKFKKLTPEDRRKGFERLKAKNIKKQ